MSQENVETVRALFADYARRDIDAVIDSVADGRSGRCGMRDGKVAHLRSFTSPIEAFEAVGLSE
jgi:ketosteroid isomerase-like protein